MKSLPIYNMQGKVEGKFPVDETFFNGKVNKPLLHQTTLAYLANLRQGCASTKTRAQVRGGGRKPWRQKGTGRARVSSIRSPLWRGGGVTFGPQYRKYKHRITKTIRSFAIQHSLNAKVKDNELLVVDKISFTRPKTKEVSLFLAALKTGKHPLIVIEKYNPQILRASRNIPGVMVKSFNNINSYDILKHKKIIFSKQALENLLKLRK